MNILTRPILEINWNNLLDNYFTLQKIAPNSFAAAVVKDQAYSLGACQTVKLLYEKANCRNFFVAHGIEGERIRPYAPEANIFVLQGIGDDSLECFKNAHLIPVIGSLEMLHFWQKNRIDSIHPMINVETGLNRLGFRECELKQLTADDKKEFSWVMSHLACGDEKDHFMNEHQLNTLKHIKNTYFPHLPVSLSASDGTFLGSEFQFDMVRLGAALYGINTAPYRENQMKNVVTVKAPVLQIASLPKGDFVGYSATYRAHTDKKIAIVSIGYGDGMPRSLSNVGKVFFPQDDKIYEARILGRLSMDNIICDVTDIPHLEFGTMAYLLADFYTLDDMARDAGTISYEILSRIGITNRYIRKDIF